MPFRVQGNNLAPVWAHLRVRPKRFLVLPIGWGIRITSYKAHWYCQARSRHVHLHSAGRGLRTQRIIFPLNKLRYEGQKSHFTLKLNSRTVSSRPGNPERVQK